MRQDFIILRNNIKLFLKYNSSREIMKGEPRRLPKQGISGEYEASVVTSGRFSKRARNRRPGSYIFAMCGQDGRYAIVCTKAYANDIAERMRIDVHTQRVGKCFIAAS